MTGRELIQQLLKIKDLDKELIFWDAESERTLTVKDGSVYQDQDYNDTYFIDIEES